MSTTRTANVFVGLVVQDHPKILRYFMSREEYAVLKDKYNEDVKLFIENEEDGDWNWFLDNHVPGNYKNFPFKDIEWMIHPDQRDGYLSLLGMKIVSNDVDGLHKPIDIEPLLVKIEKAKDTVQKATNPMNYPELEPKLWVFVSSF